MCRKRERERQRERKTERQRETEKERDREKETERQRQRVATLKLVPFTRLHQHHVQVKHCASGQVKTQLFLWS